MASTHNSLLVSLYNAVAERMAAGAHDVNGAYRVTIGAITKLTDVSDMKDAVARWGQSPFPGWTATYVEPTITPNAIVLIEPAKSFPRIIMPKNSEKVNKWRRLMYDIVETHGETGVALLPFVSLDASFVKSLAEWFNVACDNWMVIIEWQRREFVFLPK